MTSDRQLDVAFSALANATRRAILMRLTLGPATVNELADPFAMSLPAISKHLRVLADAGLIRRERNAQFRPCVLETKPLEAVSEWTEQYRPIWEARFDTLDKLLQADQHGPDKVKGKTGKGKK